MGTSHPPVMWFTAVPTWAVGVVADQLRRGRGAGVEGAVDGVRQMHDLGAQLEPDSLQIRVEGRRYLESSVSTACWTW
jgi:hypothetical protein